MWNNETNKINVDEKLLSEILYVCVSACVCVLKTTYMYTIFMISKALFGNNIQTDDLSSTHIMHNDVRIAMYVWIWISYRKFMSL